MKGVLPLCIFLLSFLASCQQNDQGNKPPAVPVVSFDQIEFLFNRKTDTTYIINFWATWCSPCVKEIHLFEKLRTDFRNSKIRVILISMDWPSQYHSRLIPFIKQHAISSEVIMLDDPDTNRWIGLVDSTWSGSIPATLIYNKNTRKFFEKAFEGNELHEAVQSVLY